MRTKIMPYTDLLFKLGYVYNDATNKSPGRISDKVRNIPEYTIDFSIQYIIPRIRTKINWSILYTGKSYSQLPTPSSPTFEVEKNKSDKSSNAKITQPFMSDRLKAYVFVNNMFDENYEPYGGQPAPGMKIWVGLTYKN